MINNLIEKIEKKQKRNDLPKFEVGDNVKVHVRIKEGEKTRIQIFEGLVIVWLFAVLITCEFFNLKINL